jgi:hypothetical protein
MQQLFLHIETASGRLDDLEGTYFPGLEQARDEAIASLVELATDNLQSGKPVLGLRIEICDRTGRVLESVPVEGLFR